MWSLGLVFLQLFCGLTFNSLIEFFTKYNLMNPDYDIRITVVKEIIEIIKITPEKVIHLSLKH